MYGKLFFILILILLCGFLYFVLIKKILELQYELVRFFLGVIITIGALWIESWLIMLLFYIYSFIKYPIVH